MSQIEAPTGRHICYDVVGEGPPLLAITGQGGSRKALLASLPHSLVARLHIIAIDNRDAGDNEPELTYYTMADMASDAIALLDALEIDRAHVVGFSMGATVALQVALDYPDRVNRLILVSAHAYNEVSHQSGDPLPPPPGWWTDDPVERWRLLMPEIVGPAYRERLTDTELTLHAEADRGNRATWAGVMRQVATRSGLDMRAHLRGIQAPTLVVHGEQDAVVPPEHGTLLAAGIPDATFLPLPQVGHLPLIERPADVASAMLAFLGETT